MVNTKKLPPITMTPEVIDAINGELAYQSTLQGSGRADAVDHGVAGQLVTLNVYVNEANVAWTKTAGDEAALHALRKVAAIAARALIQYGCPRRQKDKKLDKEQFTFFWNGPFSQWEPAEFEIDDVTYNCAEQYMMAEKARMFDDQDTLDRIMEEESPREQKKLGRSVKGFNTDRWNTRAREIVYEGNYAKFTQNPELLEKLLATAGTTLVEASPYDCVWGIGLRESDPAAKNRDKWRGTNWLGEVLTGLREDLLDERRK